MENQMNLGISSLLRRIYRIVMFSFFLNVVCMMVLIWKLLIVSPASIAFSSELRNLFEHIQQVEIQNSSYPRALLEESTLVERFLRIISDKIVNFWNRYDYNRLVDFYQTLEDSDDKDLVDFELRNYSFRYNRSVLDKEKPYNELPLVRRLAAAALMKCRDKVKHKRLNDLSGIYSYQD